MTVLNVLTLRKAAYKTVCKTALLHPDSTQIASQRIRWMEGNRMFSATPNKSGYRLSTLTDASSIISITPTMCRGKWYYTLERIREFHFRSLLSEKNSFKWLTSAAIILSKIFMLPIKRLEMFYQLRSKCRCFLHLSNCRNKS